MLRKRFSHFQATSPLLGYFFAKNHIYGRPSNVLNIKTIRGGFKFSLFKFFGFMGWAVVHRPPVYAAAIKVPGGQHLCLAQRDNIKTYEHSNLQTSSVESVKKINLCLESLYALPFSLDRGKYFITNCSTSCMSVLLSAEKTYNFPPTVIFTNNFPQKVRKSKMR